MYSFYSLDYQRGDNPYSQQAVNPRNDRDGLYMLKKEGRRKLANVGYYVDASVQKLEDYIEKSKEK